MSIPRVIAQNKIKYRFSDSNGRVARLASSFIIMRAGYRSTLLAAVEQHFSVQPKAYTRAFKVLAKDMDSDDKKTMISRVERLNLEGLDEGCPEDQYVTNMLGALKRD